MSQRYYGLIRVWFESQTIISSSIYLKRDTQLVIITTSDAFEELNLLNETRFGITT